jgi:hypothetical protein
VSDRACGAGSRTKVERRLRMSEPIRTPNYPLLSLERGVVQQD